MAENENEGMVPPGDDSAETPADDAVPGDAESAVPSGDAEATTEPQSEEPQAEEPAAAPTMTAAQQAALDAARAAIAMATSGTPAFDLNADQPEEPADEPLPEIPGAMTLDLPQFSGSQAQEQNAELRVLSDVNVQVKVELGRTRMYVEDVLRLGEGAVIELDKLAGDPVDIYVNERPIARGEILVLNDSFCVRISELRAADEETTRRAG